MLAKSGLLDITMKTAELIRSNQQAKNELVQLKVEIDQFVENVLANPENQVTGNWMDVEAANCIVSSSNISSRLDTVFYPILSIWKTFPPRRRCQ